MTETTETTEKQSRPYMSLVQVQRCELALNKRCRCRCKDTLHGAMRYAEIAGPDALPPQEWFESLPKDDPHHLASAQERLDKRNARRRVRRKELVKEKTEIQKRNEQENKRKPQQEAPAPRVENPILPPIPTSKRQRPAQKRRPEASL